MLANYLYDKAAAAYETAVVVYNNYNNNETTNQLKEIEDLSKTENLSKDKSFEKLAQSLNRLCGDKGYSEINIYNGNYQIHLFFKSENDRNNILKTITKIFSKFKITDSFQAWQFEKAPHHFCLKLSTNQTAALLGSDPNYDATFKTAQGVLSEIKKAQEDHISQMPSDILNCIVALSNIQGAGRCASISQKFQQVTNGETLWRNIASNENTPVEENGVHLKVQVENSMLRKYWQAAISLELCENFNGINLSYEPEATIQSMGGICLTPNQNTSGDTAYHGIAVLKEKTPSGESWFLHLCPGGGNIEFKEQKIDTLMPIAIESLRNNKIIPDYFTKHIGRHPGDTLINFAKWQQKQRLQGFVPPKAS